MQTKLCPYCKTKTKLWQLKDKRFKCSKCLKRFSLNKGKIKISKKVLKQIISEFVLEHSTNTILERVDISKYKLLKILTITRIEMAKDIPNVFEGIVEVDETYIGGKWKNKSIKNKLKLSKIKRGRGTLKQPVFGILCRQGKVYAEIVEGVEAKDLQPIIQKKVKQGSIICSDKWRGYTGIAAKGYVHRLVDHSQNEYSDKKGSHINSLEGFWGYLKRKMSAKGGIKREKLYLYLGEYVWRYNHRTLSLKDQENLLFKLIIKHFWSG